MNKMREIVIEKLILNISVGIRRQINKGNKSIKRFNRSKSNYIKSKIYNKAFGIKRDEEIGCHVK